MKRALLLVALALALAPSALAASGGSVVGSKHDLSTRGPGPIRAVWEENSCVFCHIPHDALPGGLSNRPDPQAVYQPYESSTMTARPGAPTGASRICLSCHDGTIAVGRTHRYDIPTAGGSIGPGHAAYIGTDLRKTHPISFAPAQSARTRPPPPGDAVKHDASGQLQCTSCHDPHEEWRDPIVGKFLVKPTSRSELCITCHEASVSGAAGSSHASSSASFGPQQGNAAGYASVGDAGCHACHASHSGDGNGRLLARPAGDDDAPCLRCHDGTVARKNIAAERAKASAHAGQALAVHDAAEGRPGATRPLPETSPASLRHVACVDCHDPHRASDRPALAGGVSGALDGAWGVDQNGLRVEQVRYEYEVCFKCHGDSANRPSPAPTAPRRASGDGNLRRVFGRDAISAHPVVAPGRATSVPSLLPPYTTASIITCGDCHGSDNAAAGVRGPHGSMHAPLLSRPYATTDFTPESTLAFALCYKCHDRAVLLSPTQSNFSEHALHLAPDVAAPCSACHTPHGISAQSGTPSGNAHLVDFDTNIVSPRATGPLYTSSGLRAGSCNLRCHGKDHQNETYGPASAFRAARVR